MPGLKSNYVWLQSWSIFLGRCGHFHSILRGLHNFKSMRPSGVKVDCQGVIAFWFLCDLGLTLVDSLSLPLVGLDKRTQSFLSSLCPHWAQEPWRVYRFLSIWIWQLTGICLTPKSIFLSCAFYWFLDEQCWNCETMDSTRKRKWSHFKSLKATTILFWEVMDIFKDYSWTKLSAFWLM